MANELSLNNIKYIVSTRDTRSGEPRINGRRITVFDVVSGIYHYESLEQYRADFELNEDQCHEAINYCSQKLCQQDRLISLCSKCVLGKMQDEEDFESLKKAYEKIIVSNDDGTFKVLYSKHGNIEFDLKPSTYIFLGNEKDFWINIKGYEGWEMATTIKQLYCP